MKKVDLDVEFADLSRTTSKVERRVDGLVRTIRNADGNLYRAFRYEERRLRQFSHTACLFVKSYVLYSPDTIHDIAVFLLKKDLSILWCNLPTQKSHPVPILQNLSIFMFGVKQLDIDLAQSSELLPPPHRLPKIRRTISPTYERRPDNLDRI